MHNESLTRIMKWLEALYYDASVFLMLVSFSTCIEVTI